MNDTTIQQPPARQDAAHGVVPVVPASLTQRLATAVVVANAGAILIAAGGVIALRRPDAWPALAAAGVTAAVGVGASVAILSMAAGRTVEWLVTFVMATAATRLFVSLIGLLVAVNGLHTPPETTGLLICCFYVVTLVVESALLTQAAGQSALPAAHPVGGRDV